MAGEGEEVEKHGSHLGDYRSDNISVLNIMYSVKSHHQKLSKHTELIALCNRLEVGRWSEGHPVFKKVDEEPGFLLVKDGYSSWYIQSSTTATGAWIFSGRATDSSSSPETGPSVRL